MVGLAPNLRLFRTFVLDEVNQDYVHGTRQRLIGTPHTLGACAEECSNSDSDPCHVESACFTDWCIPDRTFLFPFRVSAAKSSWRLNAAIFPSSKPLPFMSLLPPCCLIC
jgi:hypothetical protein